MSGLWRTRKSGTRNQIGQRFQMGGDPYRKLGKSPFSQALPSTTHMEMIKRRHERQLKRQIANKVNAVKAQEENESRQDEESPIVIIETTENESSYPEEFEEEEETEHVEPTKTDVSPKKLHKTNWDGIKEDISLLSSRIKRSMNELSDQGPYHGNAFIYKKREGEE